MEIQANSQSPGLAHSQQQEGGQGFNHSPLVPLVLLRDGCCCGQTCRWAQVSGRLGSLARYLRQARADWDAV